MVDDDVNHINGKVVPIRIEVVAYIIYFAPFLNKEFFLSVYYINILFYIFFMAT